MYIVQVPGRGWVGFTYILYYQFFIDTNHVVVCTGPWVRVGRVHSVSCAVRPLQIWSMARYKAQADEAANTVLVNNILYSLFMITTALLFHRKQLLKGPSQEMFRVFFI
jgi:hypothetical protein